MVTPVIVNVYDLSEYNSYMYWCGAGGIFHSGVEVFTEEYAYGGHDYDLSGVFVTNPRDAPGAVVYRESVIIGYTQMTQEQVHEVVHELGRYYKGNTYHLLQRNCNHFSEELCFKLCGEHMPSWVNRLASLAVCLHCLLPATLVPPLKPPSVNPIQQLDVAREEEQQNLLQAHAAVQQQPVRRSASVDA